ncbi:MAG: hypothetical protein ABSD38_21000 [Syntrophorhabdales bacterium]|jgi:hypothetical protein
MRIIDEATRQKFYSEGWQDATPEALAAAAKTCRSILLREYRKAPSSSPAAYEGKESVRVFFLDPRVGLWDLIDAGKPESEHPYILGPLTGSSGRPLDKVVAADVEAFFKPFGGKA